MMRLGKGGSLRKLCGGEYFFYFHPLPGEMIKFHEYFSDGLKPPTRNSFIYIYTHVDIYICMAKFEYPFPLNFCRDSMNR